MAHVVHIQSDEQYIAALGVLDFVKGTWQAVGPSSAPVFLLTDEQYKALVAAGIVPWPRLQSTMPALTSPEDVNHV